MSQSDQVARPGGGGKAADRSGTGTQDAAMPTVSGPGPAGPPPASAVGSSPVPDDARSASSQGNTRPMPAGLGGLAIDPGDDGTARPSAKAGSRSAPSPSPAAPATDPQATRVGPSRPPGGSPAAAGPPPPAAPVSSTQPGATRSGMARPAPQAAPPTPPTPQVQSSAQASPAPSAADPFPPGPGAARPSSAAGPPAAAAPAPTALPGMPPPMPQGRLLGEDRRPGDVAPQQPEQPRPSDGAATETGASRKVRLTVARIDPWSAMKLSFLLSVGFAVASVVATIVVWEVLNSMGVFDAVNTQLRGFASKDSTFDLGDYIGLGRVVAIATVVSLVNVVVTMALATLGAVLYNLAASLVGGLNLTLSDD